MATVEDLLAAIKHVNDCSSDPQAWRSGLTAQDVTDVATVYLASPQRLDALLAKIRAAHPQLFDPTNGAAVAPPVQQPGGAIQSGTPTDQRPTDHQEGVAADAIRSAESALAHQNTSAAQLDLQVISAILNAHLTAVDGKEALTQLQRDVESAVRTRTDLDTAAGARDFQRFLLEKLKDIRVVLAGASLDDTSKSALMAALTSLYNVAPDGQPEPTGRSAPPAAEAATPSGNDSTEPADTDIDPFFDSPLGDGDTDFAPTESSTPALPAAPSATVPNVPVTPSLPALGGAGLPGPAPGWGTAGDSLLPDLLQAIGRGSRKDGYLDDALSAEDPGADGGYAEDPGADGDYAEEDSSVEDSDGDGDEDGGCPDEPVGPTKVALPNGETITAANPKLAAAIESAVNGAPIADAFRQQGITIPPPGTPVIDRIDPPRLSPGDIGMFTDHHALALGPIEALVNGQIQHISTVQGPSFLGWEHPPGSGATAAPTKPEPPTPTRPAALVTT